MHTNRYICKTLDENIEHQGIFVDIVQHSTNPFAAGYLDGRITCWNHAFEKLTGYSSAELQHMNWIDTLTPKREETISGLLNLYYNISRSDHLLRHKDGHLIPINYTVRKANYPGEESSLYYGFITDISREKDLQEALRFQQTFKKLTHDISVRFISLDGSEIYTEIGNTLGYVGDFVDADYGFIILLAGTGPRIKHTIEWSAADGIVSNTILTATVLAEFSDYMSKLYTELNTSRWEYALARAMGEINMLLGQNTGSIMVLPMLHKKQLLGFVGYTTIDGRAWSEKEITLLNMMSEIFTDALGRRKAKQKLDIGSRLMDIVSEGIIVFNAHGIQWVNQTFTTLTGYSIDEVVGRDYMSLNLSHASHEQKVEIEESLDKTGRWQGNVFARHKKGSTFPCLLSINSLLNENGKVAFHVAIFTDITEHEKLRQEQIQLQELSAAMQRSASLSAMSAGIVHEIAQPLNSIKIIIEGLRYWHNHYHWIPTREVFDKLNEVSEELHHIDEIIRHMRSFASLSENPQLEACNLNDSVTRTLRLLSRQLTAHGIKVATELSQKLPSVSANLNRLDAVLVNLFINAMQSLDKVKLNSKQIICHTRLESDYVVLEVSDNGCGIDEDILDSIFEPFVTTNNARQGMGLGLSVVQTVITRLGGRVTACNNNMGGATFSVRLPV